METFSALLAICAGNSSVPGEFPTQRPVTRSFDVFVDLRLWINGWVNNREAGDLSRYRAHYDVTVIITENITIQVTMIIRVVTRDMHKNWKSTTHPDHG